MNMRSRLLFMVMCLTAVCRAGHCADPLWLVKDGKPTATIVIAEDAGNYQKWAAQWLRDYVKTASSVGLPIATETKAPKGNVISVGHTKMAARAGIKTDDLEYDGCRLVVRGNVLYLIGRDAAPSDAKRPSTNRGGPQGTIRAVTTFLEDVVGVRWFIPGPGGTVVPKTKDISVTAQFDRTFVPAMGYYEGQSIHTTPIADYALNFRSAVLYLPRGGHSWEVHVSDREYYKDHPEYFALLPSGKRSKATYAADGRLTRNAHLCTSNPEVRRIIVAKIRAEFDKGYDMVQLGQSDGWEPCLCAECMKMDAHRSAASITRDRPCEKIWLMHKWILDELKKSHPHKLVNVLVYGPTKYPSKKFDALPDNAITEMAPITPDRLEAWRGKIRKLATYVYWWEDDVSRCGFVPEVSPEWLQKTLRFYRDMGVIGITKGPRLNWGLGGPTYYAFGKLMGDPDTNIDNLLHEYCMGVYGDSGGIMKRFFKLFHSRSTLARDLPWARHSYPAEDAFTYLYPPKVVRELDRLLTRAEAKATRENDKQRVKHTRDCFDGLNAVAEMFAAKRFFELEPTRENLLSVKRRVEVFEQWRARILSYERAYTDRWFPRYAPMAGHLMAGGNGSTFEAYYYGIPRVWKDLDAVHKGKKVVRGTGIGGGFGNSVKAPVTWDFDKIMANLGKPKEEKIIEVARTPRPPVLDGRIGSEWEGAAAHSFGAYQSEGSRLRDAASTVVRLMYDDVALYVAYECTEPKIEKLRLKSVGRDGDVYHHDEVELFLNTDEHSDRKVMQFMASPIEDAFYDSRKGFITDALHPDFDNWETSTWNPEWRYTGYVDKAGKRWSIEMAIPFKSIGASRPQPGTVWTGNFARCRRVYGDEELSSWIGETFGGSPEYFGKMLFLKPGQTGTPAEPSTAKVSTEVTPVVKRPAKNYVRNGGFEEVKDRRPVAWSISSYPKVNAADMLSHAPVTTDKSHSGKRSLKIDFADVDADKIMKANARELLFVHHVNQSALLALRGKNVVLSMWVCYENLPAAPAGGHFPGPWVDIAVGVEKKTVGIGEFVLGRAFLAPLGYVTDGQVLGQWVRIEKKVRVPAEAEWLRVRGGLMAWNRNDPKRTVNRTSLYIDDVRLEVASE